MKKKKEKEKGPGLSLLEINYSSFGDHKVNLSDRAGRARKHLIINTHCDASFTSSVDNMLPTMLPTN